MHWTKRSRCDGISLSTSMNTPSLPFTLYPKKTKILMLFAVCLAFVAGSILMIRQGEKMGWLCAGFFGLGIPVSLLQLWPNSSFLKVTEEGLEICSLFRRQTIRWCDVSEFGVTTMRQHGLPVNRMVGFNYAAGYQRAAKTRSVARALAGFEGMLPDTYGMAAEELAQLLGDYHRKWSLKTITEPGGAGK